MRQLREDHILSPTIRREVINKKWLSWIRVVPNMCLSCYITAIFSSPKCFELKLVNFLKPSFLSHECGSAFPVTNWNSLNQHWFEFRWFQRRLDVDRWIISHWVIHFLSVTILQFEECEFYSHATFVYRNFERKKRFNILHYRNR